MTNDSNDVLYEVKRVGNRLKIVETSWSSTTIDTKFGSIICQRWLRPTITSRFVTISKSPFLIALNQINDCVTSLCSLTSLLGQLIFFCSLLIIDKEHLKMMHHVDITLHELEMFNLTSGRMGHENDNNDSGNVGGGGDGGDNGARDGSSHNLILNAPLTPCFQEDCYIRLRKETCKKFIHLFNSSRVVTKADQIALIYE